MKRYLLLRTNAIICVIIALGFIFASVLSYQSKRDAFRVDIEDVSTLAAKAISTEVNAFLSVPVSVSLSMADDSKLRELLGQDASTRATRAYTAELHEYLDHFKLDYPFDVVFVATDSGSYYRSDGNDRVLATGDRDAWFLLLRDSKSDFSVHIGGDPVNSEASTVYFTRKLLDDGGLFIGMVGIGIRAERIQAFFKKYRTSYGVQASLIGSDGDVQISADSTANDVPQPFFPGTPYAEERETILSTRNSTYSTWYDGNGKNGYLVSHYNSKVDWHLIVDNDTTARHRQFHLQSLEGIPIMLGIVALTVILITRLVKRYDARISELTIAPELEYHRLLMAATEGLYDNIFEWNITQNRIGGESTKRYLQEHFGIQPDTPYDEAIRSIAEKQFKAEYIPAYLELFQPTNVLGLYADGTRSFSYDLMVASGDGEYGWMRITARMFFWASDRTVRLISYRKNIDEEKQREITLLERAQRDCLTGLLNKQATEELIGVALHEATERPAKCAFFIFDVDDFKIINDNLGHAAGDHILQEFSAELTAQFRDTDIIGRIGGDEFVVLMREFGTQDVIHTKLSHLFERLKAHKFDGRNTSLSASAGVAICPEDGANYMELYESADHALYFAKGHGKNCYHICGETSVERPSFRIDLRDIEMLVNTSMDGVSKIACVGRQLRILYFNARRMELTGTSSQVWSAKDYNMLDQIHPDDIERVLHIVQASIPCREPFCVVYRLQHAAGHYVQVMLRGLFVNELFENEHPVFYAVYTNLSELRIEEGAVKTGPEP